MFKSIEPLIPKTVVDGVRRAHRVVVLTGAGTSAESGVPTFRDAHTGLWAQYDPHELATPEAFQRNPQLVWEWYMWRRTLVANAHPNPGHVALVAMEQHIPSFTLITQNVDGMHQRAGNTNVIELHGNITRTRRVLDGAYVDMWDTTQVPPYCPNTGSLLRPDVVWFGECLPEQAYAAAVHATQQCDVFFSIGTSGVVQPAASLPLLAEQSGAMLVIINPDMPSRTNNNAYIIQGTSGKVLPALVQAIWHIAQ